MTDWAWRPDQVTGEGPRYLQIASSIRQAIGEGVFATGDALPSEHQLRGLFGVSRPTIRRAVDRLVEEGVLLRRHGMGTFVAAQVRSQPRMQTVGFSERMRRIGLTPSSRVLESLVLPASAAGPATAAALLLEPGDPVFRLSRIRLANGEAMLLETVHISLNWFPGLQHEDFRVNSLYDLLLERGVEISYIQQSLEPVVLGAYEAGLLHTTAGSPGMLIRAMTFDHYERPVEQGLSLVRGDRGSHEISFVPNEGRVGSRWHLRQPHLEIGIATQVVRASRAISSGTGASSREGDVRENAG